MTFSSEGSGGPSIRLPNCLPRVPLTAALWEVQPDATRISEATAACS